MNETNSIKSDTVRLWTRQHAGVLDIIERNGAYRAKKEYIMLKNDNISDYYLKLYDWYIKHAEKIVPRPDDAVYPIWFSTSPDMMLQPTEDTISMEIETERRFVVFSDFEKWGYVVNYWYVPLSKEDEIRHDEELKKYGIGDESALYMSHLGNFYPVLRNKIINSWNRIFEISDKTDSITQATMWEIRKEWIVNINLYNREGNI